LAVKTANCKINSGELQDHDMTNLVNSLHYSVINTKNQQHINTRNSCEIPSFWYWNMTKVTVNPSKNWCLRYHWRFTFSEKVLEQVVPTAFNTHLSVTAMVLLSK